MNISKSISSDSGNARHRVVGYVVLLVLLSMGCKTDFVRNQSSNSTETWTHHRLGRLSFYAPRSFERIDFSVSNCWLVIEARKDWGTFGSGVTRGIEVVVSEIESDQTFSDRVDHIRKTGGLTATVRENQVHFSMPTIYFNEEGLKGLQSETMIEGSQTGFFTRNGGIEYFVTVFGNHHPLIQYSEWREGGGVFSEEDKELVRRIQETVYVRPY